MSLPTETELDQILRDLCIDPAVAKKQEDSMRDLLINGECIFNLQEHATGKIFSIGKTIFYLYRRKGFFWFRFFNKRGLAGKDLRKHDLLFSERYGHTRHYKIGHWSFTLLK